MGLSKWRSKTLLFISKVTQLLLVKVWRGSFKTQMPLVGKEQIKLVKEREAEKKLRQKDGEKVDCQRPIIWEERERESHRDIKSMPKEKGMRKSVLEGLILREPMRWVVGEEG